MVKQEKMMGNLIVFQNVRASFVYVLNPKQNSKGELIYEITMLIPKAGDLTALGQLSAEQTRLANQFIPILRHFL